MATVPLSGTNIRFMSGVPFSNDYKNTRWFENLTSQLAYFNARTETHYEQQMNFQRIEGYHYVAINKSIDELWSTNYLMFQNAQYNNKWFYAFVTRLEYKQKNLTYVHFQIDVLQTWRFDYTFKPSFVVREHCKLWNSDGTPVINTIDEGLNYGTEYDNTAIYNWTPNNGYKWLVIVAKEVMHVSDDVKKIVPTVIGTPQPLTYYLLPFKDDDTTANVVTTNGSGGVMSKPSDVLKNLYKGDNATNNIVSIFVTDHTGIESTTSGNTITFPNTNGNDIQTCAILSDPADANSSYVSCLYVKKVKSFKELTQNFGSKWTGYNTVKESKLLMYPYTQVLLTDFRGNAVSIKTEYINNSDLELKVKGSLGTSNKVSYGIQDYNFDGNGYKSEIADMNALINNTPNDIPVITDMLSAYLQGNRNSINNQLDSAWFNGSMGAIGNAIGMGASIGTNPMGTASSGMGIISGLVNTQLQIEGIHAKKQDIGNVPPSISKQGSNTSYELGNGYDGIYVIKKQIKQEYIDHLEDYFMMFGYKVNSVKVPNFHTRTSFNYVQTKNCMITGNFNNDDLQELKAIFDNGITLWHTDDVGNYSLSNGVI